MLGIKNMETIGRCYQSVSIW